MRKFYQINEAPKKRSADIIIYGEITSWKWLPSDVDAFSIINEINALDVDNINVYINSPGGEVGEAIAIYTALKRHKAKVITYCDGFACSAASIIFVAGDERIIGKLGMLMVHNCMSYAGYANADELRKIADDTDKINQASIEAYKAVCSVDENKIKELMNEESWLTADEALEYGFATSIAEPEQESGVQQSATAALRNSILNERNRDGRIEQLINKVSELIETVKPKEAKQKDDTTNDLKQAFVDFFNFYI